MRGKLRRVFFVLMPLVLILGAGILVSTVRRTLNPTACSPESYSGEVDNADLAFFDGQRFPVPGVVSVADEVQVLGVESPNNRWIEVDLSEQTLKAWDNGTLFLETKVSSGLPWWPTPKGEFRIWIKLRATKMEGGQGRNYYYLPNVPYVMFFEGSGIPAWRGYGLHGTYWHDDFGNQRSHGCVNLPTSVAQKLFYWTSPTVPEGKSVVYSSPNNSGTRVTIHD